MLQVAIIGGGMAGPVLALCLKKHGITSAIFETRSEGYKHGGNIALAPNALRVMDHIGIYDKLKVLGYNYEDLAFTNGSGELLGKFLNGSQKVYNFPALRIHRTLVREMLISELRSQDIPIYYDKKCLGIKEETESGATVQFEDGSTAEAKFVVGTDGIHSRVRSFITPNGQPEFSGLMGVMGTVMADDLMKAPQDYQIHLPCMLFGASGSFAIMPASPDGREIGYFATIEAKDRGKEGWQQLESEKDELKSMLSDRFLPDKLHWPLLVRELCEKTASDTLTSWPFFSVPHLKTWSSPKKRVIVIGDAAHAIPPTVRYVLASQKDFKADAMAQGGQGAAMAFEDAETLAYVLADFFTPEFGNAKPLTELVHKWEQHRFSRISRVVDFTTKNGSLRKSSPHFYEQAAKEWIVWAAFKWMGPEGGAQWMYSYNAECILGALG